MTLLALDVRCGACRRRPNVRITSAERDAKTSDPEDQVVGTWKCQGCGETNLLTAGAYQRAVVPELAG